MALLYSAFQTPTTGSTSATGIPVLTEAERKKIADAQLYAGAPDAIQAKVLDRYADIYTNEYAPQENALIDTLHDNSIVDTARATVDKPFDRARNEASVLRQSRRYGADPTALQLARLEKNRKGAAALNHDGGINDAKLAQSERNVSLRNSLINLGRDVQDTGMAGIGEAALRQTNRENTYEVAKAQSKANKTAQTTSLIASAAMLAAVIPW